ncbi:hypothetical protein C4K17_0788 [Pseudomonas chlororaphis subsp. aurantiaca]|nr:hypothetical protein C4K17_0788 [Pseudomonas chlororaphis subsp. aurantiaca]
MVLRLLRPNADRADRSLRQRLQGLDVWWKYPRPAPQAINGCTAMSR